MKNKLYIALLALVLGFYFVNSRSQAASVPVAYEYKFDFNTSEKKANELGSQGWDLVAVQSTGPGLGNNVPTYVFKRAK